VYFVTVFFIDPKMFPSLTMMAGTFSVSPTPLIINISTIVLNKLGCSGTQCDQYLGNYNILISVLILTMHIHLQSGMT
jgi:hypothetical protein